MSFSLETMSVRFPHLIEDIFVILHQKEMAKCREVNRFLEKNLEKFWWMRKIQSQLKEKYNVNCRKVILNLTMIGDWLSKKYHWIA